MANERYIGVEIGGTKLQVVLGDAEAGIVARRRYVVERGRGAEGIRANIGRAIGELTDGVGGMATPPLRGHESTPIEKHSSQPGDEKQSSPRTCPGEKRPGHATPIKAVGVGFGGPVDFRNGRVAASHHIEGWHGFPLVEWLSNLTGLPVAMDNDANVAALGEACHGAGRDRSRVFYITLGSGMGGGMVCDGRLYHGAVPGESEIGLLCYDPKTGADFESCCSGWATDKKVRQAVTEYPASALARIVCEAASGEEGGEAKFLAAALAERCPRARAILDQLCADLAWAISHVSHLLNPEVVILGGGLSLLGEPLRAGAAERLGTCLCPTYRPGPEVRLAALGEDVVCVGALRMAIRKSNPQE
jgi:glucokinase